MRDIKDGYHYKPHSIAKQQLDYFINQRGMSFHTAVNTALDRMYREENRTMSDEKITIELDRIPIAPGSVSPETLLHINGGKSTSASDMGNYFNLDKLNMAEITRIVQQHIPEATTERVREFIDADWAEGVTHQEWLNTTSAQEIGDWVASSIVIE